MNEQLVDEITRVRFRPTRLREGYDMGEVDRFLDDLVDALSQGRTVREMVASARFGVRTLREGYDQREVDAFLERVVERSEGGVDPGPGSGAGPTGPLPEVSPTPGVIEERRGLFGRRRR